MKRASEAPPVRGLRVVYADVDGTILGPGGSLFTAEEGGATSRPALALAALHEAGVELVPVSGRPRTELREVARLLGARAYVAELGGVLVDMGQAGPEVVPLHGAFGGDGPPAAEAARSGAGAYLLEMFSGRLEYLAVATEVTTMFLGLVDPADATAALDAAGYGWLAVHDNGRVRRRPSSLAVDEVHAYHLLPRGVSKASGVRAHRERRGVEAGHAAAVGDAPSDLEIAAEVAAFFLVANGVAALGPRPVPDNVFATEAAYGEGFAEAVDALLALS